MFPPFLRYAVLTIGVCGMIFLSTEKLRGKTSSQQVAIEDNRAAPIEKPLDIRGKANTQEAAFEDTNVAHCKTRRLESAFLAWTASTKQAVRRVRSFCPSCKVAGRIFVAVDDANNQDCGAFDKIYLEPSAKIKPAVDNVIYTIDEYHLGGGLPPFHWANFLCSTWFSNKCLKELSVRPNHWKRKLISRWQRWIRPGSSVIDIGANVGDTTIEMAVRARQTVAFEAHPKTVQWAQVNALLNPYLNITVHPVAVSDADGSMDFVEMCGGCNNGPAEVVPWGGVNMKVEKKRLDTYLLREHGESFLRDVSFIKIDTEGYDKVLLRAYKPLLVYSKPIFFVEWFDPYHDWRSAPDAISDGSKDLFAAINEIGYVPVHPDTGQIVTPENRNGIPDVLLLPAEQMQPGKESAEIIQLRQDFHSMQEKLGIDDIRTLRYPKLECPDGFSPATIEECLELPGYIHVEELIHDTNWIDGCFEWYPSAGSMESRTRLLYYNKRPGAKNGNIGGNRVCVKHRAARGSG